MEWSRVGDGQVDGDSGCGELEEVNREVVLEMGREFEPLGQAARVVASDPVLTRVRDGHHCEHSAGNVVYVHPFGCDSV